MKRLSRLSWLWVGLMGLLGSMPHARAGETVTLVMTDAQGTPVVETDIHGTVLARYAYRPYGTAVDGPLPAGPGYTGHVNDPDTGLVYMQQRYYDPEIGRFLSPDPVGPAPGNVFNFGRYTYVNDNPVRFTDPDGRCPDTPFGCGSLLKAHVQWRMSHPNAPADGLEKAAFVGIGIMAAPTVGAVSVAALRSPFTYLALSFTTKTPELDVVEAMKAAEERQRAAEIVEAAEARFEKVIEDLLEAVKKREMSPSPKLPEPPPPPPPPSPPPSNVPVVQPKPHSNG